MEYKMIRTVLPKTEIYFENCPSIYLDVLAANHTFATKITLISDLSCQDGNTRNIELVVLAITDNATKT